MLWSVTSGDLTLRLPASPDPPATDQTHNNQSEQKNEAQYTHTSHNPCPERLWNVFQKVETRSESIQCCEVTSRVLIFKAVQCITNVIAYTTGIHNARHGHGVPNLTLIN